MADPNTFNPNPGNLPVIQLEGRLYQNKHNLPIQCLFVGCTFTDAIHASYFQRCRICREHMRMPAILMDGVEGELIHLVCQRTSYASALRHRW